MSQKSYDGKLVGQRLRWFRENYLGMKQEPFAESMGLPSSSSLSQYETGAQRLPINAALTIMEIYGLSLDFLYFDRRGSLSPEMLVSFTEFLSQGGSKHDNTSESIDFTKKSKDQP